ncbi:dehydrogenase/reductase SDR family member 1 [Cricetulus griseus]|uniref:Dehydrogenase/reductase 1 n=1 Tax=Cricetulus griseus TaxID=10029 RepID=G3HDD0_CRIGR|nr:dehydrogenase/reductase SDR family member 1 [Cricetulus griseus]XP_027246334.1 dehydrogenase/reductase SDR family member 1 [Cricetulus griseus]EGW11545.1 Dehydrogenase/reductase SDR family member 1 [Cricetulus griseus]ERE89432.1 dehydrogenase/reductase SDR family member 1-like protein [Cricetulus griseus]
MAVPMKGQVCVVTGASRGIGRGIALQLCKAGATVYITGRNLDTLRATAQEAQSLGGRCVPVVCDSSQESEVKSLFEQVDREQQGRLDVLVNNAFAGVQTILSTINKPFWEVPASIWDDINNVGLRGHYLCSVYGARLMVPAGKGLIVVVSSPGGLQHMFNVPYGVGKTACDRLAADCAHELRCHGVSYVSLWPGLVQTELVKEFMAKEDQPEDSLFKKAKPNFSKAESPEMSGKCVVALATDPKILSLSGKVLPSCDLARRYGLQDVDGRPVQDYFSLGYALSHVSSLGWLTSYLPGFLRVPKWIVTLYTSKF